MKTVLKTGALIGAMAMLTACAANYDVAGVSAMADKGDGFASALHKRYVERADFEVSEGDWASVDFFNSRGEMAATGNAPTVQMPGERKLKVDAGAIGSAYNTLTAALNTNAPQAAPDACARAQTWLEHWMEQSEEGHQADDIATARNGFEKAMPECRGDVPMAMPMKAMPLPEPFVVYFTHDSFDLSSANLYLIKRAAAAAKASKATRLVLIGHADRSGSSDYNTGLSRARVIAVGNALMVEGIPRKMVTKSSAGETSPQVATDDGVRERMNRRVEVVFER